MFIGEARAKAEKLKERDRIRLGDVDVTRRYDREKNKEYYTFKVFSFDMADEPQRPAQPQAHGNPVEGNEFQGVGPDELPF